MTKDLKQPYTITGEELYRRVRETPVGRQTAMELVPSFGHCFVLAPTDFSSVGAT